MRTPCLLVPNQIPIHAVTAIARSDGPWKLSWLKEGESSVYITVYMRSADCAILAACATREINNLLDDNTPERCESHRPPQQFPRRARDFGSSPFDFAQDRALW
jgi:hypothetical protein